MFSFKITNNKYINNVVSFGRGSTTDKKDTDGDRQQLRATNNTTNNTTTSIYTIIINIFSLWTCHQYLGNIAAITSHAGISLLIMPNP